MNSINNLIASFAENPYDFEEFCVKLYQKMGFQAEVTARINDGGYDIILDYPSGEKGIVECKCYSRAHSVGRPLIQKLVGANQVVKAEHMIFITTSNYSSAAIEYAKESCVELVDGNKLLDWTHQYIRPEDIELTVETEEWALKPADIKQYIPSDIYINL